LLLEIDMALPQYTLAFWLSTLSAKTYRGHCSGDDVDKYGADFKVRQRAWVLLVIWGGFVW
jgi:hypothetical protein